MLFFLPAKHQSNYINKIMSFKVKYPPEAVGNTIRELLDNYLVFARHLGTAANVEKEHFDLYDVVEREVNILNEKIESGNFSLKYVNQLSTCLNKMTSAFSASYGSTNTDRSPFALNTQEEKTTFKNQQERRTPEIRQALDNLIVWSDFFRKIEFFDCDLAIVGSNGSGKTRLARHLPTHLNEKSVLISAQKILLLPEFKSIRSHTLTVDDVKSVQQVTDHATNAAEFSSEFGILIEHLLAEDGRSLRKMRNENGSTAGSDARPVFERTKLKTLMEIWNSLFTHLRIDLAEDINLQVSGKTAAFRISEMSDGEKVTMFILAHVLLCPQDGFVIVDEPEMYLHPTIFKRLWDTLEEERRDCIFIYLTHNLDFASSRLDAKKLWLKSFKFPSHFTLEEIPQSEIPEPLMLELLGSRQTILFCEGDPGGLDEKVYRVLFPQFTIKPVSGCTNVINFTKAFNKLGSTSTKAIGLIDSDFHSEERLNALRRHDIYNIRLSEVENILFDSDVLESVCKDLVKDKQIPKIKEAVISQLANTREHQVSFYITTKINNFFEVSSVKRGDSIERVEKNFGEFLNQIKIKHWAEEQRNRIDEIVKNGNYEEAIRVFNFKGFEAVARPFLKIGNYNSLAIETIKKNENLKKNLLKYFPDFPKTM